MKRLALICVPLILLSSLLVSAPQKRVKQAAPEDFAGCMAAVKEAWAAEKYGACVEQLKTAMGLASEMRAKSILAAMPPAPEGWKATPDKSMEQMRNNPFAAAMSASVGNIITQEYRQDEGSGHFKVTVTADSPLVSMFKMWAANPAMLDKDSEMIEYDADSAVLKTKSNGLELQILIADKHTCQVEMKGTREELLFQLFDQNAVNRLRSALVE